MTDLRHKNKMYNFNPFPASNTHALLTDTDDLSVAFGYITLLGFGGLS